jgi:sialidase-1
VASPPTSTKATIHSHKVVCKEPGKYLGWPTIAQLPSGELIVVFSGDREEHVCPYGKTELVRSTDMGATWSEPVTVNDSLIDDRDAGIVAMRSGTLVVSWFTYPTWKELGRHIESGHYPPAQIDSWAAHCDHVRPEAERQGLGHSAWTRRSADGGRTWEPPVDSTATSPHGPIELSDGRLLLIGNFLRGGEGPPKAEPIVAMESTDEGRSWHQIGTVMPVSAEGSEFNWCEPHVMELEDGTLICLARYTRPSDNARDRYMRQSESIDGGRTWTRPHPSNMWGFPPHMLRLSNGDGLASYGYRRQPYGQRACVYQRVRENLIGGNSSGNWDIGHAIVLRDDGGSDDLGYPSTVEMSPGEMLSVYYQTDKPGEKPSIMATRWTLSLADRSQEDDLLE